MAAESLYGPVHTEVVDFIQSLSKILWFSSVDHPLNDPNTIQVSFEFIVKNHGDPYKPWGDCLVRAEEKIQRLIFDHRRLDEEAAVIRDVVISGPLVESFFLSLNDRFPGYYPGTHMYAHELAYTPDRLVRGAALEIMLSDLDPNLRFFRSLMPWFESGHFPCGWRGSYPEGQLLVW